jgi:type II secretory pathway pseudopilin PulG
MVFRTRRKRTDGAGFTLLEILLTVGLLIALLGAIVYNFQSAQRGADLDEGARQIEALIRFAGAQAANSGKAVQLRFGDDATLSSGTNSTANASTDASMNSSLKSTNAVNDFASMDDMEDWGAKLHVVYEADPVLQPGVFVDLPEAKPFLDAIAERVRIDKVQRPDTAATLSQGTNDLAAAQETMPVASVTFYPDGSSDTVDIALVSKEREDYREMIVHVDGVTGQIRKELKSGDDLVPVEWMDDENSPQRQQAQTTTDTATDNSTQTTQTSSDTGAANTQTTAATMPEDPAFEQLDKPKTENTKTNAFDDLP